MHTRAGLKADSRTSSGLIDWATLRSLRFRHHVFDFVRNISDEGVCVR
jgi:hypothetical protein